MGERKKRGGSFLADWWGRICVHPFSDPALSKIRWLYYFSGRRKNFALGICWTGSVVPEKNYLESDRSNHYYRYVSATHMKMCFMGTKGFPEN